MTFFLRAVSFGLTTYFLAAQSAAAIIYAGVNSGRSRYLRGRVGA